MNFLKVTIQSNGTSHSVWLHRMEGSVWVQDHTFTRTFGDITAALDYTKRLLS